MKILHTDVAAVVYKNNQKKGEAHMLHDIILARAYCYYVKQWCDIRNEMYDSSAYHDFNNYHIENGFVGGESFNTLRGFETEEFQDEEYIKAILMPNDFEHYRFIRHYNDNCLAECDGCEFMARCCG
jgi:hypothetical protein